MHLGLYLTNTAKMSRHHKYQGHIDVQHEAIVYPKTKSTAKIITNLKACFNKYDITVINTSIVRLFESQVL